VLSHTNRVQHPPPLIDRAEHLRTRDSELAALFADGIIVPVWRGKCLIAASAPVLLEARAHQSLCDAAVERVFLGLKDGRGCFAIAVAERGELIGDFHDLRLAGNFLPLRDAELLAYARGILQWHHHHRHCAECGAPSQAVEGGHVRVCAACQARHFPRTDPAIMALIVHEDRCLLARQAAWPPGMHSILAGFVEPGESLEDAVIREVREEVGLDVTDVRYLRSQPWPFPSSLMIGFWMRALGEEIRVDTQELESARWFSRGEVEEMRAGRVDGSFIPPRYSLAHQLIALFLDSALA
jgi:NAD+ diphosphatase